MERDIQDLRRRLNVSPDDQPFYGELLHPRGQNPLGKRDLEVRGSSPKKDGKAVGLGSSSLSSDPTHAVLLDRLADGSFI